MEESVFRETKRMDDLAKCGTVQDAFVQHGLAPDDKIDRREQVLMFRAVEKEMEMELKALMADGRFDEAKELGSRLESLRSEFGGLQLKDEMDRQKKQRRLFDKATKIKKKQLKERHLSWSEDVEGVCKEMYEDTEKTMEVSASEAQRTNPITMSRSGALWSNDTYLTRYFASCDSRRLSARTSPSRCPESKSLG